MDIVTLKQGDLLWHAHRVEHLNASDAPVMMSVSPYRTRAALVRERATGVVDAEIDGATAKRFADGHRFEALARPLAEEIIGEELSPLVGKSGKYSASFDGLTLMGDVAWEHKTLGKRLQDAFADIDTVAPEHREARAGSLLPEDYRVQMEHQIMVSGTVERVLFMASRWTDDGTLSEERHCWYYPDPALRQRIVAGWEQFEADVAAYVPTPAPAPAPVAKVVASLPVVFNMRVEGRLIACNLDQYKPAALAYIAEISTDLQSDQDFADAEANAKFCRDSATKLKHAIEQALGQMGDINAAISAVREIAGAFDAKGLALEKLVKSEKEARRKAIAAKAVAAQREHAAALAKRLGGDLLPSIPADFEGAMRNKRNLDSMEEAVAGVLAQYKIAANEAADRIDANLKLLAEHQKFAGLFPDVKGLVLKQEDDLRAVISSRIAQHEAEQKAILDRERERIRAEEQAKAEAAARAEQERQHAAEEAERKRREDEERTAQAAAVPTTALPPTAPAIAPAPELQPVASGTPAANEPPPAIDTGARMTLGQINTRIAPLSITVAGLSTLGFQHAGKDKAAFLFRASDFPAICEAIAKRALLVRADYLGGAARAA